MAKYAIIIGLNYPGTDNTLRGCGNDARHFNDLYTALGYQTIVLCDAPEAFTPDTVLISPTKANIVNTMIQTREKAKSGDTVAFTYSGHGTQLAAKNNAIEQDGKTECLIPGDALLPSNMSRMVDFLLLDTELRTILDGFCPGISFVGITDGCHTGSIFNFDDNLDPQLRGLEVPEPKRYAAISGCQDNQTSADAHLGGIYQGALSAAILAWIEKNNYAEMEQILLGDSIDQKRALQKDLISWLQSEGFVQKPNIAFNLPGIHIGLLPGQKPPQPAAASPAPVQPTAPVQTAPAPVQPTAPVQTAPVPVQPTAPVQTAPVPAKPTAPVQTAPVPAKPTISQPILSSGNYYYYQPYPMSNSSVIYPANSYYGYANNVYNNYPYSMYYNPIYPSYQTYQGSYKRSASLTTETNNQAGNNSPRVMYYDSPARYFGATSPTPQIYDGFYKRSASLTAGSTTSVAAASKISFFRPICPTTLNTSPSTRVEEPVTSLSNTN